jgi:hypothetical protein
LCSLHANQPDLCRYQAVSYLCGKADLFPCTDDTFISAHRGSAPCERADISTGVKTCHSRPRCLAAMFAASWNLPGRLIYALPYQICNHLRKKNETIKKWRGLVLPGCARHPDSDNLSRHYPGKLLNYTNMAKQCKAHRVTAHFPSGRATCISNCAVVTPTN